jgi:hypothetical protein
VNYIKKKRLPSLPPFPFLQDSSRNLPLGRGMFAKNPNQMLALRHQKMDTASLPVKGNQMKRRTKRKCTRSWKKPLSLSTKPKTQKKKKKHKMKAPDQPNQKIKMTGPEFSCRSKNAASSVQALFQKKTLRNKHKTPHAHK